MRITRIDLENIKSYRRATIPLTAGTVAVRGHNGAGKSTLLEAIGFALFDALPYSQEQFVREGEKWGTVSVSFLSALDDREYQAVRRCGSSAAWYVYDPDLRGRVVEQKQDVTDFLRKHLRIESEMKLADLFNDALGVPQGTFTADFLLTPANRKKKFDTLLQVEDYRRAADNLLSTKNYLVDERRAVEAHIADLERETNLLPTWRDDLRAGRERESGLVAHLARVQAQASEVEARRESLHRKEAEVARLANELRVAEAAYANADSRARDAAAQLAEAREAVRVCEAARLAHAAHQRAQIALDATALRAAERDRLTAERANVARRHEGDTRDLKNAQTRLADADLAARRVVELMPNVARQGELETALKQAEADEKQLKTARDTLGKAEDELARATREIADADRQIASLDALRPEAALLEERLLRVQRLQTIRAQRTEREGRLVVLAREQAQAAKACEVAARKEAKASENVRKIKDNAAVAEELPALEADDSALDGQINRIAARIEQHRLSREQSGAGNCPFLREPCLNIKQKGVNSLGAYFDALIERAEAEVAPLRTRRAALAERLAKAREVRPYYDRLPEFEERHADAHEALLGEQERMRAMNAERAEIEAWLAAAEGEVALADAQALFKRSDDADKGLRQLTPLQAQRRLAAERHERLTAESETQREAVAALGDAPERARATRDELARLGNPRAEADVHQRVAAERARIEERASALARQVAALAADLARLDDTLQPFAGLDAEMAGLRDELERTRLGYQRYLQHEQVAAKLPERQDAADRMLGEAQAAAQARDTAAQAHRDASAAFDPAALVLARAEAERLAGERGRATQELAHTQQECARLEGEILRVEGLLGDLDTARAERAELTETEAMLQQFRDTIREAGPNIMKAMLRQISAEANRIFGDIMGDRSAELRWENDYEVVLHRDGKERTFAQLSGGEQMSAALAVRLALLRTLTRLDVAFFDEPTQNMDGERRSNLAEQIRRVRGFDQLIVISHDDTFEQGLDCVLHLEKRHGETVLLTEDALVSA